MTFKYMYPDQMQGIQGLQYPEQQQQPQQEGMDPSTALNAYQQFAGGSGSAESGLGGFAEIGTGAGPGAGQGMAGASGGSGSAVASAGPWAALAAIIMINEYNAEGGGYRSKNKGQYTQDLFSGEVLGQDMEKRWLPKLGLKEGSKENKWASHLIHPISADLGESWESFKDLF